MVMLHTVLLLMTTAALCHLTTFVCATKQLTTSLSRME